MPSGDPPQSKSPSFAPSGVSAMDIDLPPMLDPSDSNFDNSSVYGNAVLDEETDKAQLGMLYYPHC